MIKPPENNTKQPVFNTSQHQKQLQIKSDLFGPWKRITKLIKKWPLWVSKLTTLGFEQKMISMGLEQMTSMVLSKMTSMGSEKNDLYGFEQNELYGFEQNDLYGSWGNDLYGSWENLEKISMDYEKGQSMGLNNWSFQNKRSQKYDHTRDHNRNLTEKLQEFGKQIDWSWNKWFNHKDDEQNKQIVQVYKKKKQSQKNLKQELWVLTSFWGFITPQIQHNNSFNINYLILQKISYPNHHHQSIINSTNSNKLIKIHPTTIINLNQPTRRTSSISVREIPASLKNSTKCWCTHSNSLIKINFLAWSPAKDFLNNPLNFIYTSYTTNKKSTKFVQKSSTKSNYTNQQHPRFTHKHQKLQRIANNINIRFSPCLQTDQEILVSHLHDFGYHYS